MTYANADGFDPASPARHPRPTGHCSTGGCCPSSRARSRRRPRRPRRLRRHRRGPPHRALRRRPVELVRAPMRGEGSGTPAAMRPTTHPPRSIRCTSASCRCDAARPFTPFVADVLWRNLAAGRAGRPDLGAPRRLSRRPKRRRSTMRSTRRWRLRGRRQPRANRCARRRRHGCVSRWRRLWSTCPAASRASNHSRPGRRGAERAPGHRFAESAQSIRPRGTRNRTSRRWDRRSAPG